MNEILNKLLESEFLNEETKAELTESFNVAIKQLREDVAAEVKVELTEQFVKAQAELVDAVDKFVSDQLTTELTELKEDIAAFRDVETEKEIEYAEKLVEEKERMASMLSEEIDDLVNKIDAFLEVRIDEEFSELHEDIAEVQQLQFGRKIYEAMESEFKSFRKVDTLKVEQDLAEAKDKLADATQRLSEIERARVSEAKETKLASLLEGVSGLARDQLKVLLSNVPSDKLDEAFKKYAPRVLKESLEDLSKKSSKAILEEGTAAKDTVTVITGNELKEEIDSDSKGQASEDKFSARMRLLAGITG